MALILLVFSTIMNLMYGIYFKRPAVYFHPSINEEGMVENKLAFDEA
jgi:hypothetical protein